RGAAKPPQPRILTPADEAQVHYGQLVNFSGEAMDAQDGSLAGSSLTWSVGGNPLGTGALISADDLPVGVNQVTLTAENSEGLSASTFITVIVDDDLELPGPTLSVAPTQVGWQVATGTTAGQTEQVDINNAGGGTLDWSAEEDAAWLTLDATSGEAPATLNLTADPAGLEDGTVLSTTLRITSPAAGDHPAETMDVPVSLLVGDVYGLYPFGVNHLVYLPLVLRGY
ncbi:MAG: BACON domain-containing protein, partial [Anaerolineae bacterium]|nr:BACON domain-containing protein [Anaerolineae bacterium]